MLCSSPMSGSTAVKTGQRRPVVAGEKQTGLRHQRHQTDRFERHGFAARVRTGDDERVGVAAEFHRDRYDSVFVDERVSRVFQSDDPSVRPNHRPDAVDLKGILRLGEDHCQIGDDAVIQQQVASERGRRC